MRGKIKIVDSWEMLEGKEKMFSHDKKYGGFFKPDTHAYYPIRPFFNKRTGEIKLITNSAVEKFGVEGVANRLNEK